MVPRLTDTSKLALTIAGYDPSSGAGITADLAVFAAHGIFGLSAITALTVQSTLGVREVHPIAAKTLEATLDCLLEDTPPAGVKIGMIGSAENVQTIARFLQKLPADTPVVLDPVLVSSSGKPLLSPEGLSALRAKLLPLVRWATPNRVELQALLQGYACQSRTEVEIAAQALAGEFPSLGLVVTGGDTEQPEDYVLPSGEKEGSWLTGEHIVSNATHGTGCAFSSALLVGLMQGKSSLEAATAAKRYVAEAIRRAPAVGRGKGPMHLLWPLS